VAQKLMTSEPQALLAAVSREGGLEASMIFSKSVNSVRFIEFLEMVHKLHDNMKVAIFMDNLSVHRSRLVRDRMKELDIKAVFNVPYSPQYNPIELVFGLIKRTFKKLRLSRVAQEKSFNFRRGIEESVDALDQRTVKKLCDKVYRDIMNIE